MPILRQEVLQTLLYYDLWRHPLTMKELHAFLPVRYLSIVDFERTLRTLLEDGAVAADGDLYYLPGEGVHPPVSRRKRERHAWWMWRAAVLSTHAIKRCPFVRGVFVSGELSKGSTGPGSDVDFLIVTAPGRVWIARALLILFKKTFLLNSKKFFCVNSFISADHLAVEEHNIYQATEVAHLKATHNAGLLHSYHEANRWILDFFPNFNASNLAKFHSPRSRSSVLQKLLELPFLILPADRIDTWLMRAMERVWARRYPQFDEQTRARIFRCTRQESRAYAGNYQERILARYDERLRSRGVAD